MLSEEENKSFRERKKKGHSKIIITSRITDLPIIS